ncbi:MAG: hypothetical protein SX243_11635 [Acidobacteriota bacterium]|nr:hypothetical protein [Acidobacteriota bacterium]
MAKRTSAKHAALLLIMLIIPLQSSLGQVGEHWKVKRVREFCELRTNQRTAEASELLTDNPRLWSGERVGEGRDWKITGPVVDWYFALHGSTDYQWFRLDGETVVAEALVTDDFDRLLDVKPALFELRWYFDDSGKISGFLIIDKSGSTESNLSRFFRWADTHRREEYEALAPGFRILYKTENIPRWIALIREWREANGLPPKELPDPSTGSLEKHGG